MFWKEDKKSLASKKKIRKAKPSLCSNLIDSHTCAVGGVYLVIAMVLVPDHKLLQFACDVVGGANVGVPIGIHTI